MPSNPADLLIRLEIPADAPEIREVNRIAFARETEAQLVDSLRENGKLALSVVATLDGKVVGHILFTDMEGTGQRLAALAPMAVLPVRQRCGIGSAMVREGLAYLREQGYDGVIVLGHPEYYPRFGFRAAAESGIRTQFDVPPESLFVLNLSGRELTPGLARYPPEFDAVAPSSVAID